MLLSLASSKLGGMLIVDDDEDVIGRAPLEMLEKSGRHIPQTRLSGSGAKSASYYLYYVDYICLQIPANPMN
jgi:hypothetical protein